MFIYRRLFSRFSYFSHGSQKPEDWWPFSEHPSGTCGTRGTSLSAYVIYVTSSRKTFRIDFIKAGYSQSDNCWSFLSKFSREWFFKGNRITKKTVTVLNQVTGIFFFFHFNCGMRWTANCCLPCRNIHVERPSCLRLNEHGVKGKKSDHVLSHVTLLMLK